MNPPPPGNNGGPNFCGVIFGGGDKAISHVPLLRSIINAVIIDVSCRVTVTQTYRNESDEATPVVRYVFPVPSRAAICAFSMVTGENRLIYAQAKDKIEATKEFEAAVGEERVAALQEQVSGDIFRISLGSIPAHGTVSTKTVFVMDLMNYGFLSDKVQLLLPLALGQRYGIIPEQLNHAAGNTGRIRLEITVEIQMSGYIKSVTSSSHQDLSFEQYMTHRGRPSRRRLMAKLSSETYLDRDFELLIQANELERSRCFIENDPRLPGTVALQLMLIPHFELPPVPEQEYLFLIDRSGSMEPTGSIKTAQQSIALLLKCLPRENTLFNIFDFAHTCERLWPQSRACDDGNVKTATDYVYGLDAGGGTELGIAMGALLGSRHASVPTVAFILTDGQVYPDEAQRAGNAIRQNISTSSNTQLRLFILGIGELVSSDVCETLANAGGGKYVHASSQGDILLQCTGLVRAGRTSTIKDVSVDWTADIPPGHGPPSGLLVRQSPPELYIPEAYPSDRSLYFSIISTEIVPKQVIIRGKVDGKEVLMRVDVESVKFGRSPSGPPSIHTLAAHRLIRDIERGDAKGKGSETDQRREIVRLGQYYQLASSQTSFVAVDYGEVHPRHLNQQGPLNPPITVASFAGALWQYVRDPASLFLSPTVGGQPVEGRGDRSPGGSPPDSEESGVPSDSEVEYSDGSEDDWASSDDSLSTLSSLESYSSVDVVYRPRRSGFKRQRIPLTPQAPYTPPPAASSNKRSEFGPPPISPNVVTLVEQMSTSGSFALTEALGSIVGRDALEEARSWGDNELAATALAMVYLEKSLGDHLEVYQVLREKGMEFVKKHPNGGKFGEMLDYARMIVEP